MEIEGAPAVTVKRRIEFVDTDASGRYHYATAMRLFEVAEAELLDQLGLLEEIYTSMPRARVEFDYRRVLRFRDEVESTVFVEALGNTSITFGFRLTSGGELCVDGRLVAVFVDEEGKPRPWSDDLRARLLPGGTV
jgi:acyl-CoA thioester hydrolase